MKNLYSNETKRSNLLFTTNIHGSDKTLEFIEKNRFYDIKKFGM